MAAFGDGAFRVKLEQGPDIEVRTFSEGILTRHGGTCLSSWHLWGRGKWVSEF